MITVYVSIHPMLLFNMAQAKNHINTLKRFHTSHVTVQPREITERVEKELSFHTSHVTVQRKFYTKRYSRRVRFHTSHVTVQQKDDILSTLKKRVFPYIPCYCSTL